MSTRDFLDRIMDLPLHHSRMLSYCLIFKYGRTWPCHNTCGYASSGDSSRPAACTVKTREARRMSYSFYMNSTQPMANRFTVLFISTSFLQMP
ncbi:hypothetical protein PDESU_01831 [Pontiella desulfatans]|uniref:Uncharacterized protein n=1 Tax=Pontiella desulfatans TaxID=2750659 RepID=A0A6C2U080_PONDE|nr:hypothetical protein PDESU_01831 [Pontiella desulfatans]